MRLPLLARGHYAVFAQNFRIDMRIGVYPEETVPQPVRLDIAVIVLRLGAGDGIEDVYDYNHLRDEALALAADRHFGLQETFCEAIIARLRDGHDAVRGVIVESRKLRAFADCDAIGCHMTDIDPEALAG